MYLTKFHTVLSLAALEAVKMTTSSAASDENFVNLTFSFQCTGMGEGYTPTLGITSFLST